MSLTGFSILRLAERDLPDIAYVENLTSTLCLDKQPIGGLLIRGCRGTDRSLP
jgi:hypothetical protein